MAQSSTTLHEPRDQLADAIVESHRGFVSLMEELEAVDWYNQRVDATNDAALKSILEHNRDEEKEHAMMVLEWLRRRDPALDKQMRTYLFTDGDIVAVEDDANAAADDATGGASPAVDGSLHVGTLKETQS